MFCFFAGITLFATAQTGKITGTVLDAGSNETLIGATIILEGTTLGTITDFDGNYMIDKVPVGTYTVRCSFISYETKSVENVEVKADETVQIDFILGESTVEIGDVKVVAKANRESEAMLLVEQKNAVLATQAIGSQEISRKGASDAEAAVTKVSGISKQEGVKNVFVRGLGDRFNATSLNGFPVPSEDPEYKNISLDFFSSDIIKAVGVSKVFGSDVTGDVAGAEININSKELVGSGEFEINASVKANTETLDQDFLVSDGVSSIGFAQNTKSPASGETYNFPNSLDPSSQNFQLGKEFGIAGGKHYEVGPNKNPLSFYLIGNFLNNFKFTDGITRETNTAGTIVRDQNTKKYQQEFAHMAMANVNYSFSNYNLTYNLLFIHTINQLLRDDWGLYSDKFQSAVNEEGLIRRQQINDNTLLVNQLSLNRQINNRLFVEVGAAYNNIVGEEPDRRVNWLSSIGNNMVEPLRGAGRQHRYYGKLTEQDINALARVTYKLAEKADNISIVEVGYKGRFLTDDFEANSWDNTRTQSTLPTLDMENLSLDAIFNQEELAAGNFQNRNYNNSTYSVDKQIHSVYSLINYQLTAKLIANVGLKADIVNLTVDYDVNDGARRGSNPLDEFYLLPSLNLKYSVTENQALRFGFSRTYTLPQSKEISPLLYEGQQWDSQGNPDLIPSTNYNADLKWDFYPSRDELISVTVFGKIINDPLSKVEVNSAGGFLSYANIAPNAKIAGVEVEIRKNLFSLTNEDANTINKLSVGINFSYLSTAVKTDSEYADEKSSLPLNFTNEDTELEGASPIIANGDLSYNYRKNEFEVTTSLVANYFSDRIYSIGANGFEDIEENNVTTLDFVASTKFSSSWGLSFKAQNLLDPEYKLTRKPSGTGEDAVVLSSYKKGITLSLGLSYEF